MATSEGEKLRVSAEEYEFLKNKKHALPSKTQMAKNVIEAGIQAVATRFKEVSKIERLERLTCCDNCFWLRRVDSRCVKCGCWMAYKSKLKVCHCKIGKW
jgi:hypothetical protein